MSKKAGKFLIGPASVGILLPGLLKVGAIGGIDHRQIVNAELLQSGSVAIFSSSGGMTNELISVVAQAGQHISFALHFGGDRFPVLTPEEAFLSAENDPETKTIVYFGELGGEDEYILAKLLKEKKVTKRVICYIAGTISDYFPTPPQFGHAKAIAAKPLESAAAKRGALTVAGALVPNSFSEFVSLINQLPKDESTAEPKDHLLAAFQKRQTALFASTVSSDVKGEARLLGEELTEFVQERSFAAIVGNLFLGKRKISKDLEEFINFTLKLLTDHGPYVSGAVNTMITARAGRDLVSSLSAGLLTIGPRFGGAINQAAENWLHGVANNTSPEQFVESFSSQKKYVSGIGHRKYRIDLPDPRVKALTEFAKELSEKRFLSFALSVQKITASKKGNLILNVDGAIAAILLDILSEKDGYSEEELKKLVSIEFFNALFVLSRSVGFIAHFLDQKRIDEGLFRLPEEMVAEIDV
jgi:citrate synthase